jgi:hypothetical protein
MHLQRLQRLLQKKNIAAIAADATRRTIKNYIKCGLVVINFFK